MSQNIIYSPWERTKCPWPCLMTKVLLFSILRLFSFVSAFLTSLIKLILWLKFSTGKRQAENMMGAGGRGARTIWSCSISWRLILAMQILVANEDWASGKEAGDHSSLEVLIDLTLPTQHLMKVTWKTHRVDQGWGRSLGQHPGKWAILTWEMPPQHSVSVYQAPARCQTLHSMLAILLRTSQKDMILDLGSIWKSYWALFWRHKKAI